MADISLVLKLPDMTSKYSTSFSSLKEKFMLFLRSFNIYLTVGVYTICHGSKLIQNSK